MVLITFAWAKVGEFDAVSWNEYILGLNITMENAFAVDIINGFDKFVHVELDFLRV